MLPDFDQADTDGRMYREISLPGGTFRMFEDTPFVWKQILNPGEKSLVDKINDSFINGEITKKN